MKPSKQHLYISQRNKDLFAFGNYTPCLVTHTYNLGRR